MTCFSDRARKCPEKTDHVDIAELAHHKTVVVLYVCQCSFNSTHIFGFNNWQTDKINFELS